jgi:WD40 repeat protein
MAKEQRRRFQTPMEVAQALRPFCKKAEAASRTNSFGGPPALSVAEIVAPVARPRLANDSDSDAVHSQAAPTRPEKSPPDLRLTNPTKIEPTEDDDGGDVPAVAHVPRARALRALSRTPVAIGVVLLATALGAVGVVAYHVRIDRRPHEIKSRVPNTERLALRTASVTPKSTAESIATEPGTIRESPPPVQPHVRPTESPLAPKPALSLTPSAYHERIHAVLVAAQAKNRDLAVKELDECRAVERGWEWGYLRRLCNRRISPVNPTGRSVRGAQRYVGTLSFSPDRKKIAAGNGDRTVKVWDTVTNTVQSLEGAGASICGVAFSPVGTTVAAATTEGVRVWDVKTGRMIHEFRDHADCANTLAFSPDGTLLASGGDDKTVRIRDLTRSKLSRTLVQPDIVGDVAFSSDGQRVASDGSDNFIRIWNVADGGLIHSLDHGGRAGGVALNKDGTHLAAGGPSGIVVWDAHKGQKLLVLDDSASRADELEFSPDGQRIASAMSNKTIKVWDAATGRELLTIRGLVQYNNVAFSPDGRQLAASGRDQPVLTLWDATWPDPDSDFALSRE